MAGEIYLSNLSGQFDYQQILAKYQELKNQQITIMQQKENKIIQQKSAFQTYAKMVDDFNSAFEKITESNFLVQKNVSVSNESVANASITDVTKLFETELTFTVDQLAKNDVWLSQSGYAQTSNTVATSDGTLTLTINGTDYNIDYTANDTLADIAAKINDATQSANASIFFDGSNYRLIISSNDTGTNNAISFSDTGDLLDNLNLSNVQAAQDAQIDIYGEKVTSRTNTFENIIDGLSITVNSITDQPVTVSVKEDRKAIKQGFEDFFAAYNSLVDYTAEVTGEDGVLSGDYFLQSLRSGIFRQLTPFMEKGLISVDHTNGHISLNSDTLDARLNEDPAGMATMMEDLKTTLGTYLQSYVEPTGILDQKENAYTKKIDAIEDDITRTAARVDAEMENLKKQFIHLDGLLAQLNDVKQRVASLLPQQQTQQ